MKLMIEGGKERHSFTPPTNNSCRYWESNIVVNTGGGGGGGRTGEWFCPSLWWNHEATLARRSQTSGRDVDCYKGVEVGGFWACAEPVVVLYASISVLNLIRAATGSQCREIKRCDTGPFRFARDQSCCWNENEIKRAWTRSCAACCVRPGLSDVVQCKPARSSSFCNVVFECQLVIENYTKISDWTWWGNCRRT